MVIRNHTTKISKNISKVVKFDHFRKSAGLPTFTDEKHGRVVSILPPFFYHSKIFGITLTGKALSCTESDAQLKSSTLKAPLNSLV